MLRTSFFFHSWKGTGPQSPTDCPQCTHVHFLHSFFAGQRRLHSSGSTAGWHTNRRKGGREEQWEETPSEQEKFLEGELRSDLRLGSSPGIVLSASEKFRDPSVTHLATILLLTKRQQRRFWKRDLKGVKKRNEGKKSFHELNRKHPNKKKHEEEKEKERRGEGERKGEGGLKEGQGYNRKEEKGEKKRRISAWKGGWVSKRWPTINFQT